MNKKDLRGKKVDEDQFISVRKKAGETTQTTTTTKKHAAFYPHNTHLLVKNRALLYCLM